MDSLPPTRNETWLHMLMGFSVLIDESFQEQEPTLSVSIPWIGGGRDMDKDRVAGSAKDLAGKAEGTVGDLAGDAKAKAEGLARQATGTAQNLYGQAKDMARDATDAATGYAKKTYENSGDTFRNGSQALAQTVKENPLGSLVIAGVFGFALARYMMRQPSHPSGRRR